MKKNLRFCLFLVYWFQWLVQTVYLSACRSLDLWPCRSALTKQSPQVRHPTVTFFSGINIRQIECQSDQIFSSNSYTTVLCVRLWSRPLESATWTSLTFLEGIYDDLGCKDFHIALFSFLLESVRLDFGPETYAFYASIQNSTANYAKYRYSLYSADWYLT